jgi:hypothetical protein
METPLNTVRFSEPFDFTSVAETGRQADKSLSRSASRSWRPCGTAMH